MKVINYQIIFLFLTIGFTSCEKNEVKNTEESTGYTQIIEFRSECEECPGEDECCCGVWVQDEMNGEAFISLCGTSDGVDACSGSSSTPCASSFSGGGDSFMLDAPDAGREKFCMNEGDSFWIANTHPTNSMDIYITCQFDIIGPQILQITIPAGGRWYYHVSSTCSLTLCG